MNNRRHYNRFTPLEPFVEQGSRSSSDSPSSDASERFRRSLYEPHHSRQQELNEGRNTRDSSWQIEVQAGFRRFDRSYRHGDTNWKHFLTQTESGEELQAVYLGIKPLMTLYPREITSAQMADMIHSHAQNGFSVLDYRQSGGGLRLFSEKEVARIVTTYPEYFPQYDTKRLISSYLAELDQQPATPLKETQRGLLHGFPLSASARFARYSDAIDAVIDLSGRFPKKSHEGNLLHGYLSIRDMAKTNTFREKHQQEMRILLDTHLPYMPEEEKQYIVNLRYIKAPGILYASDSPTSPEDQALIQRAHDAFQFSGMNDYLQNIR